MDLFLDLVLQGEMEKYFVVFCFSAAIFCSLLLPGNFDFQGIHDI